MLNYRERIVGYDHVPLADLKPHPANWRVHGDSQARHLDGALKNIGLVQTVVWNRRTGHMLDGHLRRELAERAGEATLPATIVDLAEDEERAVLATFDPLGAMAEANADALRELIASMGDSEAWLQDLMSDTASIYDLPMGPNAGVPHQGDPAKLADRFLAPPFSVLDARAGWWQERKAAWLALGIQSEVGRGENLLRMSDTALEPDPAKRAAMQQQRRRANDKAAYRDQDMLNDIMADKPKRPRGRPRKQPDA